MPFSFSPECVVPASTVPAVTEDEVQRILQQRERLQEIAELRLTEPDVRATLQEICERAAAEMQLPIGLVSIVLDEAQYFVARVGIGGWMDEAAGTPAEWSFCRFGVATQQPLVVEDATSHPLVHANPLVTIEGLRCYAGVPLVTSRGHAIGSFCVAGADSREFSEAEIARLRVYAAEAMDRIEARRRREAR